MHSRSRREHLELPFALLWGLGIGAAVTAAAVLLAAFLLTKTDLPPSAAPTVGTACLCPGAAAAGFVAARRRGSQGLLAGGLAGIALWAITVIIALFVGGFGFTPLTPLRLALALSLGALSGVLAVNLAARRKLP